jgi:hypothetical protein
VQFIGVSWKDDADAMRSFIEKYGLADFPHVEDDGSLFAAYQLVSQPGWAFINDDGSATAVLGGLGLEGIAENLDTLIAN